jgi:putative FmdB family regulatory protein
MPTYQYQCRQCGYEMEEFQSITEASLVRCPRCETDNLMRILGTGSGLIFKGSGFYLTDYKKGQTSATPAKPAPPSSSSTDKPAGGSSDKKDPA